MFCAKGGLCVGNTCFEHKNLHKYTRLASDQNGVEVKHDKSGAGEEGYAAFCTGCEGSERNGTRHLRSPYCTV